jgi:hypothetical protein
MNIPSLEAPRISEHAEERGAGEATGSVAQRRGWRTAFPSVVWAGGAYALLAIALTLSTWLDPQHQLIGVNSDPLSATWAIAWVPFAAGHGQTPLFSDYMNHPIGFNLFWNNTDGIPLLIVWPITALWGAFVTFNLAMTVGVAASAFTAFIAIRRFVPGTFAAALGGLLYGFSPFMTGQLLGHVDLILSSITPPLALLLVHEVAVRQRLRMSTVSVLTASLALVQYFIWPEVLITEVISAAALLLILAVTHRDQVRERLPFAVRAIAYAGMATAAVLAYPVLYEIGGPARVQYITQPRGIFVTDALNFIVPTSLQLLAPKGATALSSGFTGNVSEWSGYVGVPLLLLVAYTVIRNWRVGFVRVLGVFALVMAILSMGPSLHLAGHDTGFPLPWTVFNNLALLDDILPARLMLYVYLALAIGLAFALQRIWVDRRRYALGALVTVVVLLPLVPKGPVASERPVVPAYFTSAAITRLPEGSVALVLPWAEGAFATPLVWQVAAGFRFRMPDGYYVGASDPDSDALHTELDTLMTQRTDAALSVTDRTTLLGLFTRLDIREVIVGPGPGQTADDSLMRRLLGAPVYADASVEVWATT